MVDECHCVTEWGHSFRPAYYRLGSVLRRSLPARCTLALTATATQPTEAAVARSLGLPMVLREGCVRENLRLHVKQNTSGARGWCSPGGVGTGKGTGRRGRAAACVPSRAVVGGRQGPSPVPARDPSPHPHRSQA